MFWEVAVTPLRQDKRKLVLTAYKSGLAVAASASQQPTNFSGSFCKSSSLDHLLGQSPSLPIMTTMSSLYMYSLMVQPPSATTHAIVADFAGWGRQQILTANGSLLSLLEVSRMQKGFNTIHTHDVFGIIRGLATFRLAGANKGMYSQPKPLDEAHLVILEVCRAAGPPPRASSILNAVLELMKPI